MSGRRSALPFVVAGNASWADVAFGRGEVRVSFATQDAAIAFARTLHLPIVDVYHRGHGMIAARRMVAHPAMPAMPLSDTIGGAA